MSATAFQRKRRDDLIKTNSPATEVAQADDLPALRELYTEIVGKKPFHGWDAETLEAKMAEAAD